MHMLADLVELVIGVDTHKDTHTAAVVAAATGAVIQQVTVPATPAGYQQLLQPARQQPGQRVWAIEGTGGYGAGLTRFLHAHAEQVVELDRRATRRHGAKSDSLDATRAAREALSRDQLAQPRATGQRAALSVRLAARRHLGVDGQGDRRVVAQSHELGGVLGRAHDDLRAVPDEPDRDAPGRAVPGDVGQAGSMSACSNLRSVIVVYCRVGGTRQKCG
jgi:transposase